MYESYSMIDNFYNYYGNLILVKNIILWGNDEYRVTYLDEKGKEYDIRIPMKEIEEDFISTDKTFIVQEPIVKRVAQFKAPEMPNKYNIVYYIGTKKVETLDYSLPIVLANGLIKKYKSEILYPQYQMGRIEKELVL